MSVISITATVALMVLSFQVAARAGRASQHLPIGVAFLQFTLSCLLPTAIVLIALYSATWAVQP